MILETESESYFRPDLTEVSIYPGHDTWNRKDEADTGCNEEAAVATRRIRHLYDSGLPFFTKTALQSLHDQLRNAVNSGEQLHVGGLDGTLVDFENEMGRTFPAGHPRLERVLVAPVLNYVPVEGMIANSEVYPYIPRLAYCNLRIQYRMMVRDKVSKEIFAPALPNYDDVRSYFHSAKDVWSESQACMRLMAIIESERPQCNKIISFALGTVTQEYQESWPQRSAFQHALVVSLWNAFRHYQPKENIVCFAQDPAYTELDKSLLSDCGISAVNDPEGFLQLDDASAVLSCSPDIPVKEVVFELAIPALIIWDTVRDSESRMPRSDPDSRRVKEILHANYDRVDFPGEYIYFGDLSVYIRRW